MECIIETIGKADQGCNWTSFASWDAIAEDTPDIFHIGVVYPAQHLIDDFKQFSSWTIKRTFHNFLLISVSGKIIASKIDDNLHVYHEDIQNLFQADESIEPNYKKVVGDFIKEHFGVITLPDQQIYFDQRYHEKIEIISPDFQVINVELISYLSKHPEYLPKMHWRKFEQLLNELFKDMGYHTEIGPGTGDEGVDIHLISKNHIGQILTLVQAKRYSPEYPISRDPVQALYGAVVTEGASRGILVSTSDFQPAAKKFAKKHPYRLELAGLNEIQVWLETYLLKT